MHRSVVFTLALLTIAVIAVAQDSDQKDKSLDVRSSVGDLHVGPDADAKKAGLPLYPGARLVHDENSSPLNLGLLMENFGMKLVVAKYESDDTPEKVISYYRGRLKRYGKVLECHSQKQDDGVQVNSDGAQSGGKSSGDREVTCDQNSGPVTELKVGTNDNQHVVAVEPRDSKGCTFSLVYVYAREKDDEI
jgi:hypothetical protein